MKFNPKSLKSFFNFIRKSPIDDMAVNAVKNNADDVAMGALDVVDDIPRTHLNNPSIPFPEGTPDSPVTVDQFKEFYNKRRAEDVAARSLFEGFPYDKNALTKGYTYEISDAKNAYGLPLGRVGITSSGHSVKIPEDFMYGASGLDPIYIDGKTFHYPADSLLIDEYRDVLGNDEELLKIDLLNNLSNIDVKDASPYTSGEMPFNTVVYGNFGEWRPHKGDALGKFYKKHGRLPKELNSELLNPYIDLPYDEDLPF